MINAKTPFLLDLSECLKSIFFYCNILDYFDFLACFEYDFCFNQLTYVIT
jgi:hypothetical protein